MPQNPQPDPPKPSPLYRQLSLFAKTDPDPLSPWMPTPQEIAVGKTEPMLDTTRVAHLITDALDTLRFDPLDTKTAAALKGLLQEASDLLDR